MQSHDIFDSCYLLYSIAFDMGCWVGSVGGMVGGGGGVAGVSN